MIGSTNFGFGTCRTINTKPQLLSNLVLCVKSHLCQSNILVEYICSVPYSHSRYPATAGVARLQIQENKEKTLFGSLPVLRLSQIAVSMSCRFKPPCSYASQVRPRHDTNLRTPGGSDGGENRLDGLLDCCNSNSPCLCFPC